MESNIKVNTRQFLKMSKDIANSKYPENFYFDAKNIRLLTHKDITTGGFEIERSNLALFKIGTLSFKEDSAGKYIEFRTQIETTTNAIRETAAINTERLYFKTEELDYLLGKSSVNQVLVGYCNYTEGFILVTTDGKGVDCIWKLKINTGGLKYKLELLYVRNLNLSTDNMVQVLSNYENENIYKIYIVDGKQQIYHLNINHYTPVFNKNLIDVNLNQIRGISEVTLSQPEILGYLEGGSHKAGKIQYAYNLYNLNGGQSVISPLSEFAILNNKNRGGDLNEEVSTAPQIKISNINNQDFTNIKIYSIYYSSLNTTPTISLIADEPISSNEFIYSDFGRIINTVSLEEFIFLGSNYLIPKHIESKNNRLFLANYKEKVFDIDEKLQNIDFRAWSFLKNSTSVNVANSVSFDSSGNIIPENLKSINKSTNIDNFTKIDLDHSTINLDFINRVYLPDSTKFGAEGPFIKLEIERRYIPDTNYLTYKDGEIYRFGIQFYNKYGLVSQPKWITDIRIPDNLGDINNLTDYKVAIKLTLKQRFYDWLNDDNNFLNEDGVYDDFLKPTGYKLVRADRTLKDRTIICQGILNGMISQIMNDDSDEDNLEPSKYDRINKGVKLPSLMRPYNLSMPPLREMKSYLRLDGTYVHPGIYTDNVPRVREINGGNNLSLASQWEFNNMVQMFSPEITFGYLNHITNTKLFFRGSQANTESGAHNYLIDAENYEKTLEARVEGGILFKGNNTTLTLNLTDYEIWTLGALYERFGLISRPYHPAVGVGDNTTKFSQFYRKYDNFKSWNFHFTNTRKIQTLYGNKAEITETGQGRTYLNNDPVYVYYNSWEQLVGDEGMTKVNSWGAKCLTMAFAQTNGDSVFKDSTQIRSSLNLENYKSVMHPDNYGGALIGELILDTPEIYSSNIYGGFSVSSKKRTNYIEIGPYSNIENNLLIVTNSGDTYVNFFRFAKIVKTDTEVYNKYIPQFTEIVEFKVETSIDLNNRKDVSINNWYDRLHPRYEEYHNYNLVYSQQPNLIIRRPYDYKFLMSGYRSSSIIPSKKKIPGEYLDSWLDYLVNDSLDLDGKYGEIRNILTNNDILFSFQDFGVAMINVEPRTQVQANDGISLELGTGNILNDYKYLTTVSGSVNKWGIISTQFGIFYIDLINKSLMQISKDGIKSISEQEGFHKEFLELLSPMELEKDEPLNNKGIILGFNKLTSDLFISVFTNNYSKTLAYNLKSQGFTSYYDYNSKFYMDNKSMMLTINHNTNQFMEFHGGYDYGRINGETVDSYIEYVFNPEPEVEKTINNLEFKSECYDNDDTEVIKTWDKIEVYNEYQFGESPINRFNSRFLNRKWRVNIPRNQNARNRIRNTWCNIKLTNFNENNNRLITHNISTYYVPHYKQIL